MWFCQVPSILTAQCLGARYLPSGPALPLRTLRPPFLPIPVVTDITAPADLSRAGMREQAADSASVQPGPENTPHQSRACLFGSLALFFGEGYWRWLLALVIMES